VVRGGRLATRPDVLGRKAFTSVFRSWKREKVEKAKEVDEVACVAAANEAITSIDATATLEVLV